MFTVHPVCNINGVGDHAIGKSTWNWPKLEALLTHRGQWLPAYVREEFEGYLRCGRLEHGFMRVACEECREERLVAFSCKGRGFCPSCGAKRMVEGAALLADEILPDQPIRQWVISFLTWSTDFGHTS